MSELTLNSINSSGIKVSETYQEESESESQERDLKNKDQTNGTHSSNTSMLNHSPIDSLKKPKSLLDMHCYLKYFQHSSTPQSFVFYSKNLKH
jgi:hypothetical protein